MEANDIYAQWMSLTAERRDAAAVRLQPAMTQVQDILAGRGARPAPWPERSIWGSPGRWCGWTGPLRDRGIQILPAQLLAALPELEAATGLRFHATQTVEGDRIRTRIRIAGEKYEWIHATTWPEYHARPGEQGSGYSCIEFTLFDLAEALIAPLLPEVPTAEGVAMASVIGAALLHAAIRYFDGDDE